MCQLFDIAIPYSRATETTCMYNKTSEFLLHLDCLDPVENEQWAFSPFFLPNTTGIFTFSTHQ